MKELWMILIMVTGSGLWALGGWRNKVWRRYAMPIVLYGLLFLFGVGWLRGLVAMGILCGVTHLGYGDSTPWWGKILVGTSYALPSIVITGLTIWTPLVPLVFLTTFALSRWKPTANDFTWKICEYSVGSVIAISLIV